MIGRKKSLATKRSEIKFELKDEIMSMIASNEAKITHFLGSLSEQVLVYKSAKTSLIKCKNRKIKI